MTATQNKMWYENSPRRPSFSRTDFARAALSFVWNIVVSALIVLAIWEIVLVTRKHRDAENLKGFRVSLENNAILRDVDNHLRDEVGEKRIDWPALDLPPAP